MINNNKTYYNKKSKKLLIMLTINFLSLIILLSFIGFITNLYFAIGYVILIFIHELGHFIAARIIKAEVTSFLITPYGGGITIKPSEENFIFKKAYISLFGPFANLCIIPLLSFIQIFIPSDEIIILVFISILLNISNLLPIPLFDGGNIVEALDKKLWIVGYIIIIIGIANGIISLNLNIYIWLIIIIGLMHAINQFLKESKENIDKKLKIKIGTFYIIQLVLNILLFYYINSSFDIKSLFANITNPIFLK